MAPTPPATIAAPKGCYACFIPAVRDLACRYCKRYKRACGRHEDPASHTH